MGITIAAAGAGPPWPVASVVTLECDASTSSLCRERVWRISFSGDYVTAAESRPRRQIPKRHRGHRNAGSPRRLIDIVTQSPA
jgi:hypothetical protein